MVDISPPVVDINWANEQSHLVMADVRWYMDGRPGRTAYEQGHLPGAVFVDLDQWLAGPSCPEQGRHPLPDPSTFAAGMSSLGIGDGSTVVAYDDQGGVIAARLVWMLRATGHRAVLLDGGLLTYGGPLEMGTGRAPVAGAHFTVQAWPAERLADIVDASDQSNLVLDARPADRYRGQNEHVDPRAGHIPGALSLPCRENLDGTGRFLPVDMVRQRFQAVGVKPGARVVSYCGSGVTACHNLLALEMCGLGLGRLYPGSWSEYSATDRALAT